MMGDFEDISLGGSDRFQAVLQVLEREADLVFEVLGRGAHAVWLDGELARDGHQSVSGREGEGVDL